ncbi:GNAT family N-acetyltransferase [Hymenobacter sp. HD11105]
MIHFDHYTIRLLTPADLGAFFQLVRKNRPRLENFFTGTVSRTKTLDDTRAFVADITQRAAARIYFPYLIIDTANNQIAGFLDLKNIDWNIPKSELGCYIDADYEGQGLTTKAFCLFCDHCFQVYGFKKLFLRTHLSNMSARRVAEKAGFELEGTLRRDYKTTSGELVDLLYYGKLS